MAGLGLILSWGGYLLFTWGYVKVKGAYSGVKLSIADLALPSHRAKYVSAVEGYKTVGKPTTSGFKNETGTNTVGLPPNSPTIQVDIAKAKQDVAQACAGTGASSTACTLAKARLKTLQSMA